MAYTTLADLETRFGVLEITQLTNRDSDDAINLAIVNQAIADADAEVDSYLVTRYALPLAAANANLARIAADIVRYRLYENEATTTVTDRYHAALAYLKLVSSGRLSLGPDATGEIPDIDTGMPEIVSPAPIFVQDTWIPA